MNSNMGEGKVIRVSQAQARMGGSAAIVLLHHSTQDWQMRCDSAVCLSQEKADKEPELHVNSNWFGMGRNSEKSKAHIMDGFTAIVLPFHIVTKRKAAKHCDSDLPIRQKCGTSASHYPEMLRQLFWGMENGKLFNSMYLVAQEMLRQHFCGILQRGNAAMALHSLFFQYPCGQVVGNTTTGHVCV